MNDTQRAIISGEKLVSRSVAGTLRDMRDWRTYYSKVVAPKLRAKKAELGRSVPERSIAFDLQMATGQESSRSLLAMWLRGEREPTITQFMALCERMGIPPIELLQQSVSVSHRTRGRMIDERNFSKARNNHKSVKTTT